MTNSRGQMGERHARNFLEQRGLLFLEKNYQRVTGEIDLIMQDQQAIVFVEVKCRQSNNFSLALESVTSAKQRRIINTAYCYLRAKNLIDQVDCRFDVVAIENKVQQPKIEWIQHAFTE